MNKRAPKPTPPNPLDNEAEKRSIRAGIITVILTGIFGIIAAILANPNTVIFPTKPANTATFAGETAAVQPQAPTMHVEPSVVPTTTPWPLTRAVQYTDNDAICTISTSRISDLEHSGAVEIRYDIPSAPGYCSWVVPLNGYDAGAMNTLTFWVKGQKGGEAFDVGIARTGTAPGQDPKIRQNAATAWQQISIPLADFGDLPIDSLENLSLGFTHALGSGTIFVSDFVFTQ